MNNIEQMNFVIWAAKRDPKFTQSRKAYVSALWAWRKIARKDPMVDKVGKTSYN
jgi:type IV secretory pathway TrbD component